MTRKFWLALFILCSGVLLGPRLSEQVPDRVEKSGPGPATGTSINTWKAPDSAGASSELQAVVGRRGALLTFLRSAEW